MQLRIPSLARGGRVVHTGWDSRPNFLRKKTKSNVLKLHRQGAQICILPLPCIPLVVVFKLNLMHLKNKILVCRKWLEALYMDLPLKFCSKMDFFQKMGPIFNILFKNEAYFRTYLGPILGPIFHLFRRGLFQNTPLASLYHLGLVQNGCGFHDDAEALRSSVDPAYASPRRRRICVSGDAYAGSTDLLKGRIH